MPNLKTWIRRVFCRHRGCTIVGEVPIVVDYHFGSDILDASRKWLILWLICLIPLMAGCDLGDKEFAFVKPYTKRVVPEIGMVWLPKYVDIFYSAPKIDCPKPLFEVFYILTSNWRHGRIYFDTGRIAMYGHSGGSISHISANERGGQREFAYLTDYPNNNIRRRSLAGILNSKWHDIGLQWRSSRWNTVQICSKLATNGGSGNANLPEGGDCKNTSYRNKEKGIFRQIPVYLVFLIFFISAIFGGYGLFLMTERNRYLIGGSVVLLCISLWVWNGISLFGINPFGW